ncbi:MAG: tetratricopeptide repeat protein, partial [bacterium]
MLAKKKALNSIRQARKFISQGHFEEAEELLWEAISVLEKAKDLTGMREAFGILEELQKSRGWEENLFEVYRKWIQRDPENPEVLRALSRFYVRKKDCSPLAIKIYEKTLTFHPDEAVVLTGYAECLIRSGKRDEETLKVIQRATEVDKLWIRGLKYLAEIYRSDPKYARQEEEVNKRLHALGALDAEGIVRL